MSNASDRNDAALIQVASEGRGEVVGWLLEHGADISARDEDGLTALHWAAEQGHWEVVDLLLKSGADVNAKSLDGSVALHRAVWKGDVEVQWLLMEHGADANAKNNFGRTPLDIAQKNQNSEVLQALLGQDASSESVYIAQELKELAPGNEPYSLHVAVKNGELETVDRLLKQGTDINRINDDGLTPLQIAAKASHLEIVRLLLKHGAQTDMKS